MKNIKHLMARDIAGMRVSVVPVCFEDNVGGISDTSSAPAYLEKHGFSRALSRLGARVAKERSVREKNFARVVRNVRTSVERALNKGEKCMVLGGTHTIALGSIGGALNVCGKGLGVIWIDAHGDLNTHKTSPTGNLHGMILAALMGVGDRSLTELVPEKLSPKNLLHIGLRDADPAELALIEKRKLNVVTMGNIAEGGLRDCAKRIRRFAKRHKQIWVSVDMDVVDQGDAPGTPMAARGGLTYREVTHLTKHIGDECNVVGMDFVEVAPKKDIKGKTARLVPELAAALLGSIYSWYVSEYLSATTNHA